MKHSDTFYILFFLTAFLVLPSSAYASVNVNVSGNADVSVHQEGSSQSTTCINGSCTTSGGSSKTEICKNGNCQTFEGNTNYESEDGSTKVHINNNSAPSSTTPTITVAPSVQPTIEEKKKELANNVAEAKSNAKRMVKSHDAFISKFIKEEIASIQEIFDKFFGASHGKI